MFKAFAIRKYARWGVACMFAYAITASQGSAQHTPELTSLDMWIVQRYRSAQLLPDSSGQGVNAGKQTGAPRVESARSPNRRDTVVALHFSDAMWRPTIGAKATVQLADPTGSISGIGGQITARRAFRTPRRAGARDTVSADWRIGWAYLVAIPARTANAATTGVNGWALVEMPKPAVVKPPRAVVAAPPESPTATLPRNH